MADEIKLTITGDTAPLQSALKDATSAAASFTEGVKSGAAAAADAANKAAGAVGDIPTAFSSAAAGAHASGGAIVGEFRRAENAWLLFDRSFRLGLDREMMSILTAFPILTKLLSVLGGTPITLGVLLAFSFLHERVKKLIEDYEQASEAHDNFRKAMTDTIGTIEQETASLEVQGAKLEQQIAKLQGRPVNNFTIALEQAITTEERLAASTQRLADDVQKAMKDSSLHVTRFQGFMHTLTSMPDWDTLRGYFGSLQSMMYGGNIAKWEAPMSHIVGDADQIKYVTQSTKELTEIREQYVGKLAQAKTEQDKLIASNQYAADVQRYYTDKIHETGQAIDALQAKQNATRGNALYKEDLTAPLDTLRSFQSELVVKQLHDQAEIATQQKEQQRQVLEDARQNLEKWIALQRARLDAHRTITDSIVKAEEDSAERAYRANIIPLQRLTEVRRQAEDQRFATQLDYLNRSIALEQRLGEAGRGEVIKLQGELETLKITHVDKLATLDSDLNLKLRQNAISTAQAQINATERVAEARINYAEEATRSAAATHRISIEDETRLLTEQENKLYQVRDAAVQKKIALAESEGGAGSELSGLQGQLGIHTQIFDVDKQRFDAELRNLSDRLSMERQILDLKRQESGIATTTATPRTPVVPFGGNRQTGGDVTTDKNYIVGELGTEQLISGSKSYLVGQNGPSLFRPPESGQIIPHDKIGPDTHGIHVTGELPQPKPPEKETTLSDVIRSGSIVSSVQLMRAYQDISTRIRAVGQSWDISDYVPEVKANPFGKGFTSTYDMTSGPPLIKRYLYDVPKEELGKASEAYKKGNYLQAVGSTIAATPVLPGFGGDIASGMVQTAQRGMKEFHAGEYGPAAAHAIASLIPLIGPNLSAVADKIASPSGADKLEGLGQVAGWVTAMGIPFAGLGELGKGDVRSVEDAVDAIENRKKSLAASPDRIGSFFGAFLPALPLQDYTPKSAATDNEPAAKPSLLMPSSANIPWMLDTGFGGHRQHGGSVSPDKNYMVGEAGHERFLPDSQRLMAQAKETSPTTGPTSPLLDSLRGFASSAASMAVPYMGYQSRTSPTGAKEYIVSGALERFMSPSFSGITDPSGHTSVFLSGQDTPEAQTHERIHQIQDQLNRPTFDQVVDALAPEFHSRKETIEYVYQTGVHDYGLTENQVRKAATSEAPATMFESPQLAINKDNKITVDEHQVKAYQNYKALLQRLNPDKQLFVDRLDKVVPRDLVPSLTIAREKPFGGYRQAGGPVVPNTSYNVGEVGAERFVPSAPGTVIDAELVSALRAVTSSVDNLTSQLRALPIPMPVTQALGGTTPATPTVTTPGTTITTARPAIPGAITPLGTRPIPPTTTTGPPAYASDQTARITELQAEQEEQAIRHQQRLDQIASGGAEKELRERISAVQSQIQLTSDQNNFILRSTERANDARLKNWQETSRQWVTNETAAINTWYTNQRTAIDKAMQDIRELHSVDSNEYRALIRERQQLDEQYYSKKQQLDQKAEHDFQQMALRMREDLNRAVEDMIFTNQKLSQIWTNVLVDMEKQFLAYVLKIAEIWAANKVIQEMNKIFGLNLPTLGGDKNAAQTAALNTNTVATNANTAALNRQTALPGITGGTGGIGAGNVGDMGGPGGATSGPMGGPTSTTGTSDIGGGLGGILGTLGSILGGGGGGILGSLGGITGVGEAGGGGIGGFLGLGGGAGAGLGGALGGLGGALGVLGPIGMAVGIGATLFSGPIGRLLGLGGNTPTGGTSPGGGVGSSTTAGAPGTIGGGNMGMGTSQLVSALNILTGAVNQERAASSQVAQSSQSNAQVTQQLIQVTQQLIQADQQLAKSLQSSSQSGGGGLGGLFGGLLGGGGGGGEDAGGGIGGIISSVGTVLAGLMFLQEGGIVPETGLGIIHANEMVLPPHISQGMQSLMGTSRTSSMSTISNAPTSSTTHEYNMPITYAPNIQMAPGASDPRSMFREHSDEIGKIVREQVRTFNRGI